MKSRYTIVPPYAILVVALVSPSAFAQGRGGRAGAGVGRAGSSINVGRRNGIARPDQGRFSNGYPFLFPPYFYPDYGPAETETPPDQYVAAQLAPPPAPAANPVEPLVLENRGGQWVRIPNASQMPTNPLSTNSVPTLASNPQSGVAAPVAAAPPLSPLPPAIVVFRDGHMEEVDKYMIQGDALYTSADYWTTGSWTKKIPLAELDLPASLKLNKERGAKFNLPSAPNEVVIRF
jgi:hypothetical protein